MSLALVKDRRPGLLAYVDGLPRAHDLVVSVVSAWTDKHGRWARSRRRLENILALLDQRASRDRLHHIGCEINALCVWMPSCTERIQLLEAAHLLLVAPDYSRVHCDGRRTTPWPGRVA